MLGQTSPISARFEALDALRGVCALLVVLFHIPIYHALKDVSAFANLQFCVDMFFALSGFVLCHAYGQRLNDGADGIRFTVMRFARLWPLHVVMLALFVSSNWPSSSSAVPTAPLRWIRRPSPRDVRSGKSSPIFCFCSRSDCIRA